MIERNFLILVEGRKDTGNIARIISIVIEHIINLKTSDKKLKIKIIKDSTKDESIKINNQDIVTITNITDESNIILTNIYIKRAINQNLKNFVEYFENNYSLEKVYGIKNLTYAYSIFDYDPGSTTELQLKRYFNLKEIVENFYSIINYPGIEAQEFHYYCDKIIENYKKLEIKDELEKYIFLSLMFSEAIFYLKIRKDISNKIKVFKKSIMQYLKKEKIIEEENIVENYYKYLEKVRISKDNFEILDKQKDISKKVIDKERILLVSFVISVIENIVEWIIDEEE